MSRGWKMAPARQPWRLLAFATICCLFLVVVAASAGSRAKPRTGVHRNDAVLVSYVHGFPVRARGALNRRVGAWTIRTFIDGTGYSVSGLAASPR